MGGPPPAGPLPSCRRQMYTWRLVSRDGATAGSAGAHADANRAKDALATALLAAGLDTAVGLMGEFHSVIRDDTGYSDQRLVAVATLTWKGLRWHPQAPVEVAR